MTAISDFIDEVARELDSRGKGPSPSDWTNFCRMMYAIDRDPVASDIRSQMERIVQRDERFQDRARALLPILLTLLSIGSVQ